MNLLGGIGSKMDSKIWEEEKIIKKKTNNTCS